MVKQSRNTILMWSQSLPEGKYSHVVGWIVIFWELTQKCNQWLRKRTLGVWCVRPVVFISSMIENNSKDAAMRKTSNFVIRKWPQNYLIYVNHKHNFISSKLHLILIVRWTLRSYNIPHKSLVLSLSSHWTLTSRNCRALQSSSYWHVKQGQSAVANYRTAQHIISRATMSLLQKHRFFLYSLTKYTQSQLQLP